MENLEECVVCATLVIAEESTFTLTKPTINNNLSIYFLVKKMLDISDSTFVHLLESWGDPCNWISCCWKCSKTVLEAQQLFVEMKKLEGQLNQIRKTMKNSIFKCNESPRKFSRKNTSTKASAIKIIREETVERFKLLVDSEQNHLNAFEEEIKIEIEDDISGSLSDEVEDPLMCLDEHESEESYNEDKDTVKHETKSRPQSKNNSSRRHKASIRSIKSNSTGFEINKAKVVEDKNVRRSRSGRVIKSVNAKYNSDSSESSEAFLQEKQGNFSDIDYSTPRSPVAQGETNKDKLNEGENSKKNKNTFHCTECPKKYSCQYNVDRHRKQIHGSKSKSVNHQNGEEFEGDQTLDGECSLLPAVPECICDKCGKKYSRQIELTKHIKNVHEGLGKLKRFSCEFCPRKFTTKRRLDFHIPSHKKHKCPECGKLMKDKWRLRDHIEIVHQKKRNFICEICNASFTQKRYLGFHKMKKHDIELENIKLKCDECGKNFSDPSALRGHIDTIHRRIFKFRCPVCNAGRKSASALKTHMTAAHTTHRPTVCEICQKSFYDKTRLKYHMRVHTGEKPHQCKFCSKGFKDNKAKKRHEESVHSVLKNYQCEFCGKSYPSKDYLISHRWYSHNNKKSTLPPRNILPKEEVDKIAREQILKEKPSVPRLVVSDKNIDNSLELHGSIMSA